MVRAGAAGLIIDDPTAVSRALRDIVKTGIAGWDLVLAVALPTSSVSKPVSSERPMGLETLSLQTYAAHGSACGHGARRVDRVPVFSGLFAPSAELWDRWTAHDDSSAREVDYDAWTSLLGRYASKASSGVVVFDYGGVSAADRATLQEMIAAWAAVPVSSLNRAEQQAFWINLYNAATVELVLRHYPVESIRDTEGEEGSFRKRALGTSRSSGSRMSR